MYVPEIKVLCIIFQRSPLRVATAILMLQGASKVVKPGQLEPGVWVILEKALGGLQVCRLEHCDRQAPILPLANLLIGPKDRPHFAAGAHDVLDAELSGELERLFDCDGIHGRYRGGPQPRLF